MNTKGIKFLAVVAVMAMAFAAFAAFAYTDGNSAENVEDYSDAQVNPAVITDTELTKFYVNQDTTVKIKADLESSITFYVQTGKTLDIDVKEAQTGDQKISIFTVAGDQQFTTSITSEFNGKYVYATTEFTYGPLKGQTVYYKAADVKYNVTYTHNENSAGTFSYTESVNSGAQVSADKAFATVPTAKVDVNVASGQTIVIETPGVTNPNLNPFQLGYGVYYKTVINSTTSSNTYYAPYSNAGSIAIDGTDEVTINSGSVSITTSGTTVKATGVYASTPITVDGGTVADSVNVTGKLSSGSIALSGLINPNGMIVDDGATVTIGNKAVITQTATMTVDGTLNVKTGASTSDEGADGKGIENLKVKSSTGTPAVKTGVLVLQNGKLWAADPTDGIRITTTGFNGLIETSAISKVAEVKDEIATSVIAHNQTFELVKNTTVFQSLEVDGILIVDEGVTLTIENDASVSMVGQYSQIINNGKIIVKAGTDNSKGLFVRGGVFVNNGTMEFSAKSVTGGRTTGEQITFNTTGAIKFVNNGTVNISKNDAICLQDFYNNKNLNIGGTVLSESKVFNYGRIVYNGAELGAHTTSVLGSVDATVFISSVKMSDDTVFTVQNNKMVDPNGKITAGNATVTIEGVPESYTVRGVTFTGSILDSTSTKAYAIDLQGAMGAAVAAGASGNVAVKLAGSFTVDKTFSIPKGVQFNFNGATKLDVSGDMIINKEAALSAGSGALTLYVDGSVIDYKQSALPATFTLVGAMYQTNTANIYTTLEDAIEDAYLLDIFTVEAGNVTIVKDITIPAGMTVSAPYSLGSSSNTTLKVGNSKVSPTVTIKSTGRISNMINVVNGTVTAEDSADVSDDLIFAHVKTENGDSVTYKSLKVALAEASAGDVINLNKYYSLSGDSLTIPAGVTIDATANQDENTELVFINSNVTINGTLITDQFYFIATTSDDIGITVQEYMKIDNSAKYMLAPHWFTPIGVSYTETTYDLRGDEVTYFVITSLDHLQDAVWAADDSKVTVEGKAKLGDVTIVGTEDEPAEVTFNDDISAGTITLDNAIIIAKSGKKITGTFADEYGAITIRGAYVGGENKKVNIYSLGENGVYISGPLTDVTDGTYSILFEGKTGMNNATIGWGAYSVNESAIYPTITFAGDTLATGTKNVIANNDGEMDSADAGIVTISGSLTADNGSKVAIGADVDVLGTLAAKESAAGMTNGSVEVTGNIFLGATQASIYNPLVVPYAYAEDDVTVNVPAAYGAKAQEPTTGVATLTGKIDVDEHRFITALAGTSIDESIIEDMDSMDIVIDGKLWLTVYGYDAYSMDGLKAPITDSKVKEIVNADGEYLASFSHNYGVIYNSRADSLANVGTVYISLDYQVFTVLIKTDASIKAVYIDNILAYTGNEENQFRAFNIAAGTHTVSVEPATGYTADKAYLYTEMGTILKGLKFTFNQNDCDKDDPYLVIYNVAGTEKIVDPEPLPPEQVSEWTVTTILLLVLVILIAIMAVIVALRLNRS